MGHPRELIVSGDVARALLSLALPMVVTNAVVNLFNLTDMYFVGRLGSVAVAAVGMVGVISSAMMTLVVGLATATRAMVSRYIGAQDFDGAHRSAVAAVVVGLGVSVVVAAGAALAGKHVLKLMGARGELLSAANSYMLILMSGAFTMVLMFVISSTLQGAGDAKTPMVLMVSSVLLNIVLDPLFIFGWGPFPRWGVNGAAVATVLARLAGLVAGAIVLTRGVNAFRLDLRRFRTDLSTIKKFFEIAVPGGGQVFLNTLVGFLMMRLAAGFGVDVTAAYTIGIRLNMMALLPGYALGNAAAAVVGQNLGAGERLRARKAALVGVLYYEALIVPLGILYFALAHQIPALFSKSAQVIVPATAYLRLIPLGYPLYAVGAILLRAINGSGHTTPPFLAVFVSLCLVQLPLAFYLAKEIGALGIWWAIFAGMVGQGTVIVPYFFTMRWAKTGRWQ